MGHIKPKKIGWQFHLQGTVTPAVGCVSYCAAFPTLSIPSRSFSSTVLAFNGYLGSTLFFSWIASPSFCSLADFRRGKAGILIHWQRHDNDFLSCQARAPP
jgi:hypothetical protein